MDVAGDRDRHFGIERLIDDNRERGISLADERARVERGDDRPFFPGLERRLGDRWRRAAAARADVEDVNVLFVNVLQLEGELSLGAASDMAKVVVRGGEHFLRPLFGL